MSVDDKDIDWEDVAARAQLRVGTWARWMVAARERIRELEAARERQAVRIYDLTEALGDAPRKVTREEWVDFLECLPEMRTADAGLRAPRPLRPAGG